MRTNKSGWARSLSLWSIVVAVAAVGLAASNATAETVHLIAAPVTKIVKLPNGSAVPVPMWGYALDGNCPSPSDIPPCYDGVLNNGEVVTVPGPRIVVPPGEDLVILLTNLLPEPTSLVIPGQPFDAHLPVRNADGRLRAMTGETPSGAVDHPYTFTGLKPGTFLYQSGSHPAVQVQMGLYGAMTKDQSIGSAYTDVPDAREALLVFSEIDVALHNAVDVGGGVPGTYGTSAGPTSTVNYSPSLFLINGESYTNESMATTPAGTAGQPTLLRLLNAGLRTHAPVLDNGSLKIVAEDGNKLQYPKDQATVMLAAGKTYDALWTPDGSGVYSLYDRALSLNGRGSDAAGGQGSAGMLAKLGVNASGTPDSAAPVAGNDSFFGVEDCDIATCSGPAIASPLNSSRHRAAAC
jgi:FtsP/CotA-like multicopper oxidase with cupredoxin domain